MNLVFEMDFHNENFLKMIVKIFPWWLQPLGGDVSEKGWMDDCLE